MKAFYPIALILLPMFLMGQQRVDISGFAGFANYQGDLSPDAIEFSETKVSFGGALRYHITDKLKVRANVYLGFISGSDANDQSGNLTGRGWSFKADILEYCLMAEYHPIGKDRFGSTGIFEPQITPYVFTGFGMVNTKPAVSVTNTADAGLFPETDFTDTHMVLPLGIGVRADIFEFVSLGLEGGWRFTSTDYLDGVKMNGNPNANDLYMFFGVTLTFFLDTIKAFEF